MDIATTKTVNGLLGIPDHHQPATWVAVVVPIDAVENGVLLGIGILELVHQRHRPGIEQTPGQATLVALQGVTHANNQLVERQLTARGQAFGAPLAKAFYPALPESDLARGKPVLDQANRIAGKQQGRISAHFLDTFGQQLAVQIQR